MKFCSLLTFAAWVSGFAAEVDSPSEQQPPSALLEDQSRPKRRLLRAASSDDAEDGNFEAELNAPLSRDDEGAEAEAIDEGQAAEEATQTMMSADETASAAEESHTKVNVQPFPGIQWYGSVTDNFKDGFDRAAIVRPDYVGLMTPDVENTKFEDTSLRQQAGVAIEETLAAEKPKLLRQLQADAKKTAEKMTRIEAKRNSEELAVKAYGITRQILSNKAWATCKRMSYMRHLPMMCSKDATTMFEPVNKTAQEWAKEAEKAAFKDTAAAATSKAFRAVRHFPAEVMSAAAYQAARQEYAKLYAQYKEDYMKQAQTEMKQLQQEKEAFFAKAQADLIVKMKSLVKNAVWASPMTAANKILAEAAKKKAAEKSAILVTRHMAPKFVKAAQKALVDSVRKASKTAIMAYEPDWPLSEDSVGGLTSAKGGLSKEQSTDLWDWAPNPPQTHI